MGRSVIVTGASGLLGRHVATAFRQHGWQVRALDLQADAEGQVETADLTDLQAAMSLIRDADAVAHVASLPRPVGYERHDVFHTNMTLMFNVLEAMEAAGIGRLIFASSFSVLGLPFAPQPVSLHYLPVDEHHPAQPQDVYAVTKWLGEEMVEAWVRRGGGTAVSLRMPWIQTAESFPAEVAPRRATPEAKLDLCSYIDARDAGSAFLQAAEAGTAGHERLFISAADSYSEMPTAEIAERFYPGIPLRNRLEGHSALLDCGAARQAIGFQPAHSWRDYPGMQQGDGR